MRQTGPNWELIVVNNGSTDGTADYLAGVQDASPVPVTVIANATNRGFPAAINQGLQYARGEYLVLLNNDVVVTDGWLGQLIGLARQSLPRESEGDRRETGESMDTDRRVHTSTEIAENHAEKWQRVSEVTDAYPGRNITVIDLALESGRRRNPKSKI